ncbi:MAG: AAA family ATPase [Gammaproteobacteria bacterium]
MYTSFFGLNEEPFAITPNPRYLYMSERHTEALAHLIYGIKDSGGFIQLTGEVGTGKTTLIRSLLQRLPKNADVALILNPQLNAVEFLAAIITELGAVLPEDRNSLKELTDTLNKVLLENHSKGHRTILIVDEAQNFNVDVLEQIRLLTNLETSRQKLLQITLIGQPELRTMLDRTNLRQLAQRITGRYHLEPLNQSDTAEYIRHRLQVAGATRSIFSPVASRELYKLSGGVPRLINVIADRALLGAYTQDEHEINAGLVNQAAGEVFGEHPELRRNTSWVKAATFAVLAAGLIAMAVLTTQRFLTGDNELPFDILPAVSESVNTGPVTEIVTAELEALIENNPDKTDTRNAFANLFAIWGVSFDSQTDRACDQAEQYQLFCMFQRGSLAQIQKLDRPVILTLQDRAGMIHQVVLTEINGSTATIRLGEENYAIALDEISAVWFGEFTLLWRPQIGTIKSFYPGMRDPDVIWLRESLATIQGIDLASVTPSDIELFDETLENNVKDYQVTHRLNVDGLVGQQTQILINTDLGADTPRLVRQN